MLVPACGHQYICHKKEAMHSIRKIVGTIIITVLATIEILQSQNIGIGTVTPLQQLDVNGAIRVSGTTVANTGELQMMHMDRRLHSGVIISQFPLR